MRSKSITKRIIVILILSLLPFIIGLSFSLLKSSDREYLSAAINIAGSERMRTMLIANYAQQLADPDKLRDVDDLNKTRKIFVSELKLYEHYYQVIIHGNSELAMKKINSEEFIAELELLAPKIRLYIKNAENIIINPNDQESVDFIIAHAMPIKDIFHSITELFQEKNDKLIVRQKIITVIMVGFATIVTVIGLFMTRTLKQQRISCL